MIVSDDLRIILCESNCSFLSLFSMLLSTVHDHLKIDLGCERVNARKNSYLLRSSATLKDARCQRESSDDGITLLLHFFIFDQVCNESKQSKSVSNTDKYFWIESLSRKCLFHVSSSGCMCEKTSPLFVIQLLNEQVVQLIHIWCATSFSDYRSVFD